MIEAVFHAYSVLEVRSFGDDLHQLQGILAKVQGDVPSPSDSSCAGHITSPPSQYPLLVAKGDRLFDLLGLEA
jgi:hypothetical protein